uniref:Uncharacterized protein n=1 Tax=Lactuca sativa TaxID=4236 RepID=A0A9R1WMP2_LACSA|nr:hypothetical protein LSAT_V11C900459270 [Lactuca sativa]
MDDRSPMPPLIHLRITTQILKQTTTILSIHHHHHLLIFIFLLFLILSLHSNVEIATHSLASFIDHDPSIKSLFSRLHISFNPPHPPSPTIIVVGLSSSSPMVLITDIVRLLPVTKWEDRRIFTVGRSNLKFTKLRIGVLSLSKTSFILIMIAGKCILFGYSGVIKVNVPGTIPEKIKKKMFMNVSRWRSNLVGPTKSEIIILSLDILYLMDSGKNEAHEMLKVAHLKYDNASDALMKKAREVAHKFGDKYD